MKKKKVSKLKLQKVKISHLKGGTQTQNAANEEQQAMTWGCAKTVWCTYSCWVYSCICDTTTHTMA